MLGEYRKFQASEFIVASAGADNGWEIPSAARAGSGQAAAAPPSSVMNSRRLCRTGARSLNPAGSCHELRNAGQVFATNRETRKRCGEIRLKQVCGRC